MSYDSRQGTIDHIARVRALLYEVRQELQARGRDHDESKLEEPEKSMFDEYAPLLQDLEYGSDEYKDALKGMGEALLHHYAQNSHHPEHFPEGVNDMTLLDVIEMLCDWKAAGERHDPPFNIHGSIEHNRVRFQLSSQLCDILHNTAKWLEGK